MNLYCITLFAEIKTRQFISRLLDISITVSLRDMGWQEGSGGGFLGDGNDQCIQFMKIHRDPHLGCMLCAGLLSTSFQKFIFSRGLHLVQWGQAATVARANASFLSREFLGPWTHYTAMFLSLWKSRLHAVPLSYFNLPSPLTGLNNPCTYI